MRLLLLVKVIQARYDLRNNLLGLIEMANGMAGR